jgi:hypothetical protein
MKAIILLAITSAVFSSQSTISDSTMYLAIQREGER